MSFFTHRDESQQTGMLPINQRLRVQQMRDAHWTEAVLDIELLNASKIDFGN